MLGVFDEGRLDLEEIHRFPNGAVRLHGSLRWDLLGLYREMLHGFRMVAARGLPIAGLGVDSWAIDYGLRRGHEPLLRPAYHYRDPRHDKAFRAARSPLFDQFVFAHTGIQFLSINTIYQLLADQAQGDGMLEIADRLLLIPDWFHFLLCGCEAAEESNASTTQLYDPRLRRWSDELITRFGIPRRIFADLVPPGTVLAPLLPEVREQTGLGEVPVIAGCTHDTAAAVAAVPAQGEDWAYLSSGTWSLIGVELNGPLINEAVQAANFTNEVGYGGTIRFLKNINRLSGCCRNAAASGCDMALLHGSCDKAHDDKLDYENARLPASAAPAMKSLIQPDDTRLSWRRTICPRRHLRLPPTRPTSRSRKTPGEFARCVFESLALLYRVRLDELERLTGTNAARASHGRRRLAELNCSTNAPPMRLNPRGARGPGGSDGLGERACHRAWPLVTSPDSRCGARDRPKLLRQSVATNRRQGA